MTEVSDKTYREESEEGCKQGGPLRNLLEDIIFNKTLYFDKREVLNSDGRKALARILKMSENEKQRYYLRSALKDPTYDKILKIYNILFEKCIYGEGY